MKEFYNKHKDFIELGRAYLGVFLAWIFFGVYNNPGIQGFFGQQVNQILIACSGYNPMCPLR